MGSHLTRADFPALHTKASVFDVMTETAPLVKAGARKNMADAGLIQEIHDHCMKLADGAHCGMSEGAAKAAGIDLAKAGARHSSSDLAKIKTAHDTMCGLGAKCAVEQES